MARKKKKKKKTTKRIVRIKRIAWGLGIAALVTITMLRYFQTVRGGAFLLDAGFSGRYRVVQEALSEKVTKALYPLAIFSDDIKISLRILTSHIVEQTSATANQTQQSSSRGIILAVSPHVLG